MRATTGVVSHSGRGEESRVFDTVSLEGIACRRRCDNVTHRLAGIYSKSGDFPMEDLSITFLSMAAASASDMKLGM